MRFVALHNVLGAVEERGEPLGVVGERLALVDTLAHACRFYSRLIEDVEAEFVAQVVELRSHRLGEYGVDPELFELRESACEAIGSVLSHNHTFYLYRFTVHEQFAARYLARSEAYGGIYEFRIAAVVLLCGYPYAV